jgi:chitodextrinase
LIKGGGTAAQAKLPGDTQAEPDDAPVPSWLATAVSVQADRQAALTLAWILEPGDKQGAAADLCAAAPWWKRGDKPGAAAWWGFCSVLM